MHGNKLRHRGARADETRNAAQLSVPAAPTRERSRPGADNHGRRTPRRARDPSAAGTFPARLHGVVGMHRAGPRFRFQPPRSGPAAVPMPQRQRTPSDTTHRDTGHRESECQAVRCLTASVCRHRVLPVRARRVPAVRPTRDRAARWRADRCTWRHAGPCRCRPSESARRETRDRYAMPCGSVSAYPTSRGVCESRCRLRAARARTGVEDQVLEDGRVVVLLRDAPARLAVRLGDCLVVTPCCGCRMRERADHMRRDFRFPTPCGRN